MPAVGYLGPSGSYSMLAAEKLCPGYEKVARPSFRMLVNSLLNGESEVIVLPVENSLNGGVNQNLDLLQATDGIIAFEQCTVKIDHRLAILSGAEISGIRRIYSHQQALAQCGEYLFSHFPGAKLIATQSTSASLDMIKTPEDAGIVGAHVCSAGIELSAENIADEKNNCTNFLLIKKGLADTIRKSSYIFFSATCSHAPGELNSLLSVLGAEGLNMTKIQSRPIKGRSGEYRFFIEIEADISQKTVQTAIEKFKSRANSFKYLGIY